MTEFHDDAHEQRCQCEMCGATLTPGDWQHAVSIQVQPTCGRPAAKDEDGDRDHLLELHELLEKTVDLAADEFGDGEQAEATQFNFALCQDCRDRFCDNPLGREPMHLALSEMGFSEN